jgi:hypothetical protein
MSSTLHTVGMDKWMRFELRAGVAPGPAMLASRHSCVEYWNPETGDPYKVWHSPGDKIVGYHCTQATNLVRSNPSILDKGTGIFGDERQLRFGSCTHDGNAGVNFYSMLPYTNFDAKTRMPGEYAWIALEIEIAGDVNRLKGGSMCRHCHNGPAGCLATAVKIKAVWVPYMSLPDHMRLV